MLKVWGLAEARVQAAISIGDKQDLSRAIAGGARLLGVREQTSTAQGKYAKSFGRTLQLRPGAGHEGKMAGDLKAADFGNLERPKFQFLCNGPTRHKADPEPGFHGGLDGFGGIQIHHPPEGFEFVACLLQRCFDDVAGAGTLFSHEKTGVEQLPGRKVCGLGIGRRDQDEFIPHKGFGMDAAPASRAFDESDGNLGVEEQIYDLLCIAAVDRKLYARVLLEKRSDQTGQDILGNRCRHAERKLARELSVFRADLLLGGGGDGRDFIGVALKDCTVGGESDPVRRAIEKTYTQIVLQRLNLKRDGGLGEEKMLGGFAKTQLFGDGTENLQAEIFQLGHGEDYL